MREHQLGQDRSVKSTVCGRMEVSVDLGTHRCSLPLIPKNEKTRDCSFDPRRPARFGETTSRLHQTNQSSVPKPREKPACSKTPLHAATKLPTCQRLWQPLLASLHAFGREEATTALLTFLAQRSAAARRAVTTAKPPARLRHSLDHAGIAPIPALSECRSPRNTADAPPPALDPPQRRQHSCNQK